MKADYRILPNRSPSDSDYTIKGVIWYQGCTNVGHPDWYEACFQAMIEDWREQFGNPEMPFYFVQLANYLQPSDLQPESMWARLRESQADALCLKNTGMAVNIDLGDAKDIHPKTKRELGRRLAAVALHNTYGKKVPYTAPVYDGYSIQEDGSYGLLEHISPARKTVSVSLFISFSE